MYIIGEYVEVIPGNRRIYHVGIIYFVRLSGRFSKCLFGVDKRHSCVCAYMYIYIFSDGRQH